MIKFPGLFQKILELFDVNPAVVFKFIGIFVKFLELLINYSFKLFIEFLGLSKRSNS